jgi:parallel beta-helix repeat protein
MTTTLSPAPKLQFFGADGTPLVGGKLYTYAAGTSTPLATYVDSTGTTANTNPVILDSRGEANVWLASASYKFVLKTSTDTLIWTVDNITTVDAFITSLAGATGSSLVGYSPAGTGAVTTTVQAKLRQNLSVKDFGATGDGTTDDTTAFQNALTAAAGKSLYVPNGTYLCTGLTIYSGTNMFGDSPTTSIIKAKGTLGTSTALLKNPNQSGTAYAYTDVGITVSNIRFDGNNLGSRTAELVSFGKVNDLHITNCQVYNVQYIGLALAGCLSVTLSSCTFTECGSDSVIIEGGAALWMGPAGDTTKAFDVSVTDSSFNNNNWSAMYANGDRLSIIGNYLSSNKESGIFMTGSNNVIADNWISGQTKKYISASGIEVGGGFHTISGNFIGDCDDNCISLTDVQYATITGNTLYNPRRNSAAYPNASCIGFISLTASPNQPRYILIVGNNMWAPASDAYAAVYFYGTASAPQYITINDNQMNGNTWTSGQAIYVTPNQASISQIFRDNPGAFDVFDYGGYAAGRFYAGEALSPAASGTLAVAANTMYATPFVVRQQQVWTKIGVNVTTAVAATYAYLGIYRMENGIPTTRVLDAGAVGLDSTGTKEITISQVLPAGMYAIILLASGAGASVKAGTLSNAAVAAVGTSAIGTADTIIKGSATYGTLPATFPAVTYASGDSALFTLRYGV